jgi:hypothetical protein
MTLGELRALARIKLDDLVEPYLWADDTLNLLINQAQDEALVRSGGIVDDYSPVIVQGLVLAGNSSYPVDARILKVESVYTNVRALVATTAATLAATNPSWDVQTGQPTSFIYNGTTVRLYPIPEVDTMISMSVRRGALTSMTTDTQSPEVPYPLHNALLHFVLSEAYSLPDADISNPDASAKHLKAFEGVFGPRPSAKGLSTWKGLPARTSAIMRRL